MKRKDTFWLDLLAVTSGVLLICYGGVTYSKEKNMPRKTHIRTHSGGIVYEEFDTWERYAFVYHYSNGPILNVPMGAFGIPIWTNQTNVQWVERIKLW